MPDACYFVYGETEVAHLKSRDKALARVIDEVGMIRRRVIPDMFMALVNSIIGQQISTKAQATIWERVLTVCVPVTPERVVSLPVVQLQGCGITMRKAGYIHAIASAIVRGELDLAALHQMEDAELCKCLSQLNGIGVWTAEMLMIFSMQRMNILSWGDLAIQRGLRMLYRHRVITPALFAKYKKRYSPYATVASLYLWALAGGACAGYRDPAARRKG